MGPIMNGAPVLKYTASSAVIVFHGNSLVYGLSYATDTVPALVQVAAPINNTSTCVNRGVNGIQTPAMITNASTQVDALYSGAKDNIVVFWEGRNSIYNGGKTPSQAWADVVTYCADRLAAHPGWKIVLMTLIPQRVAGDSDASCAVVQAKFDEFNALMRAGWRAAGAKACCDVVQEGSPFRGVTTLAHFNAGGLYNTTADPGYFVHLTNTGNAVIASQVSQTLRRLTRR